MLLASQTNSASYTFTGMVNEYRTRGSGNGNAIWSGRPCITDSANAFPYGVHRFVHNGCVALRSHAAPHVVNVRIPRHTAACSDENVATRRIATKRIQCEKTSLHFPHLRALSDHVLVRHWRSLPTYCLSTVGGRFIMAALCNRGAIIFLPCSFFLLLLSSSIFFSSPNLSGRRSDVCHTSTHGVALVRI